MPNAIHYVTITHQRSTLHETVGLVVMGGEEDHPTPRVMGGWVPVRHRIEDHGRPVLRRKLIPLHAIVDVEDHGPATAIHLHRYGMKELTS